MVKKKAEGDPITEPRVEGFNTEEGWSETLVESHRETDLLDTTGQADYPPTTGIHVPPVLAEVAREGGHVGSAGGPAE